MFSYILILIVTYVMALWNQEPMCYLPLSLSDKYEYDDGGDGGDGDDDDGKIREDDWYQYPVVRCFSDPESLFFHKSCEGCHENLNYTEAFIEHYKTELLAAHPRLPVHRAVCVDLLQHCECIYSMIDREACEWLQLLDIRIMAVGDSLMQSQVLEMNSLCGHGTMENYHSIVAPSHGEIPYRFDPGCKDHLIDLREALETYKPDIVYIGFGMHHMYFPEGGARNTDVNLYFEQYIGYVVEFIHAHMEKPVRLGGEEVLIVWSVQNSICTGGWQDQFQKAVQKFGKGNVKDMTQFSRKQWIEVLGSMWDRVGSKTLRNRAIGVLKQKYPKVGIVDGFHITDQMCMLTKNADGRHFPKLDRVKLSLFYQQIRQHVKEQELLQ